MRQALASMDVAAAVATPYRHEPAVAAVEGEGATDMDYEEMMRKALQPTKKTGQS
jgi:hypothetical protein